MKLESVIINKSPDNNGYIRVTGRVSYKNINTPPEDYWFEVPEALANGIGQTGNSWLMVLTPLAVFLKEDLEINLPVDWHLLNNLRQVMGIWQIWFPDLSPIAYRVNCVDDFNLGQNRREMAFFSGGIDSFFTILHPPDNLNLTKNITDLIFVEGFDIPLENSLALQKMQEKLRATAQELEKNFFAIRTNLRQTLWKKTDWGKVAHGCALASISHLLEKNYSKAWMGSTGGYHSMGPLGSHVALDPLFTSKLVQFIHDGALFNRFQKTEFLSKFEIVLKNLHVCWQEESDTNCSKCTKCYRTMIMLDALGVLHRCGSFDISNYKISNISRFYTGRETELSYLTATMEYAKQVGRRDLLCNVKRSINRSKRINHFMPIINFCRSKRLLWRFTNGLLRDKVV